MGIVFPHYLQIERPTSRSVKGGPATLLSGHTSEIEQLTLLQQYITIHFHLTPVFDALQQVSASTLL